MTARSSDDEEQLYQFLAEYIAAKGFPPSLPEIAKAMNWGDLSLPGRRYHVTKALKALQRSGKIWGFQARRGSRPNIRLTATLTQNIAPPSTPTEKPSAKPAIPKPGKIICAQCRNPVCEKSKWYCEEHLLLNRQAAKRRRRAPTCMNCPNPAEQGKRRQAPSPACMRRH
jgi:hypothetical protein